MNCKQASKENTYIRLIITVLIAFIGGIIFSFVNMPIPWLLGPMAAVLTGSKFTKIQLYWSGYIRDTGLIIIGYSIGLSFTKNAIIEIIRQLPWMLLMTVIIVSFCAAFALLASKLSGIDYPTLLTGSIPGGLTQMVTLAEEIKGVDLTIVTIFQVTRLILIVFFVPLLVFSPLFAEAESADMLHTATAPWDALFPQIIPFAIVSVLCAGLGKKINLPTAYLLGPMIGTAVFPITGIQGPALPSLVLNISQFMIGGYIGLLLKPDKLNHKANIILLAVISGLVMIVCSWGLSWLLTKMLGISASTTFLSVAPGGSDQMGIIAHEVQADLSIVAGYQLFRTFFIYFVVTFVLKWFFKFYEKKTESA